MVKPPDDRRQAVADWLRANGVDPNHVPRDTDLTISTSPDGTRHLNYEAFVVDSEGRKMVDERGTSAAIEPRTVPLAVPPPGWWQPHQKPIRGQLLAALERCRTLINAGPNTALTTPGDYEHGWDAAMEAIQTAIADPKASN
ncbi:hypothetical protein HY68_36540 [Streptomyces sp. AcH 505]|uniref:hypothetical protein n=1 Tax=Streptomyces sp. AcH 505 TaxID=352211 RepID=UPI0005924138|nr:hypothetical protein HY68_36540 [Streptomyces sp. AcH 505]